MSHDAFGSGKTFSRAQSKSITSFTSRISDESNCSDPTNYKCEEFISLIVAMNLFLTLAAVFSKNLRSIWSMARISLGSRRLVTLAGLKSRSVKFYRRRERFQCT